MHRHAADTISFQALRREIQDQVDAREEGRRRRNSESSVSMTPSMTPSIQPSMDPSIEPARGLVSYKADDNVADQSADPVYDGVSSPGRPLESVLPYEASDSQAQ